MKDLSFTPTRLNPDDRYEDIDGHKEVVTFPLSDDEILKIAKNSSKIDQEKKRVEAEAKAKALYYKEQIGGYIADLKYNFKLITDEAEDREVECTMRKNYTRKIVQFVYNGQIVKERPMHEFEMTNPNNIMPNLNALNA